MNAPPLRPAGNPGPLHPSWQSISVRPWSLARLKQTINPAFPAGTIVALSNELLADYSTPTKYEGQGSPNVNASTRVRVYLWRRDTEVFRYFSRDGGKPLSIQHKHLVDPITFTLGPPGGWAVTDLVRLNIPRNETASYTTDRIPLPNNPRGVSLAIPNGTVASVSKCMSPTNLPRTAHQQEHSKRVDWWYVVEVDVRRTQWDWFLCREYVSVLALEPLQPQEVIGQNEFIRSTSGPQFTVLSKTPQNPQ